MKIKLVANILLATIVLSSCGVNQKAFQNSRNVAVISFNSSEKIKNNASLQSRLVTEARFDSAVVEDPAGKIQDQFYKLDGILISKIVDEQSILSSESFQKFAQENEYNFKTIDAVTNLGVTYAAVEGYPVIKAFSKKTIMESFNHLPSTIDAVIVVSNNFQLEENATIAIGDLSSAGLGSQRVQSMLSVYMVNREGKKIISKTFIANSGDKLDSKKRGKDLDEIANQALDGSFGKLNAYLLKKLKS